MTDSDTAGTGVGEVRAAAEQLKRAVDRHLAAIEERAGESDPTVQDAYSALHDAAHRYDDLLFEVHDEVTPFVFTEGARPLGLAGEDEYDVEPESVSMLARWDFEIEDRDAVIEAGRTAAREAWVDDAEELTGGEVADIGDAFARLIDAYGHDDLVDRAEDFGLVRQGGTTWLVAGDPAAGEDWMDDPFSDVGEDRLIYRVDEIFTTGPEEDAEAYGEGAEEYGAGAEDDRAI